MNNKQDLKSLTRIELIDWFKKNKLQGFRAKQVFNWIYKNGVSDPGQMNNLPGSLVDRLEQISYMTSLSMIDKQVAPDGTIKYLWKLADGETIESVYLPYYDEGRHSICISSQVGCAMGCSFCATGLGGIKRDLTVGEIVDQVLKIQDDISLHKFGEPRISNIVFMGMGEPLDNYQSVLKAINIINDDQGLDIGMRKLTISTSGIVPGILRLSKDNPQIGLAISLNAPNNSLRNVLMPINKKYPIEELIKAVNSYIQTTNRRVTFEYVLMKDINDSPELAEDLGHLVKGLLCHINLIPVNPVEEINIERPTAATVNKFKDILLKNGLQVTVRQERGTFIDAACGQLRRSNDLGGD